MNRIKAVLWISILFLLNIGSIVSQEECEYEASSKAAKLLEKSQDKKKYKSDQRHEFLVDALDEDEECLPCMHKLGVSEFKRSKRSNSSFGTAEQYLTSLVEMCPEYHSDPFYYLGAINYANQDYDKALEYFEIYLHFPDDDETKFEKDYDRKYEEVQEALPQIAFWKEFYNSDIEYAPRKVEGVCSPTDDYLPAISPDGEIMFYTRKLEKKAKGDYYAKKVEEFTYSHRADINGVFDAGEALPSPFNQGDNYGGATISVNNKEMIIAKKNPVADNAQNIDLYTTNYELVYDENQGKEVYMWSELESLGENVNTDDGWEAQPSLSGDGQMLFFAAVRPGCKTTDAGDLTHDIFISKRQDDGSWGKAENAGDVINTKGQEKSPFMHSDSKTLYFASSGHLGKGGMDIFYCKMKEDGSWSKPKNIGYPINTTDDESGLIVSADGEEAFFFSRKLKGSRGFDIYAFELPEKAKPEKVIVLKGQVNDEEGNPEQDARVRLTYAQSKEVQEIEVDASDGKYATIVNLERNEDVLMSVKKEGTAFNSRIVIEKNTKLPPAVIKLEIETQNIKTNKGFVINDIYYATNSAEIGESSKLILIEFAAYLKENANLMIEIGGHTDDLGSDDANLALSMERAFEVMSFLHKQGVTNKRVTAKGFGETKPVAKNDTEKGRALNRRTEFVVKRM